MLLDPNNPKHAHVRDRLRDEVIVWLASVRPDGRPHLVPVWFLWDEQEFIIFSQPGSQKIRNLRAHPQVTLALEAREEGEDIAIFEGTAEIMDATGVTKLLPAYDAKYHTRIIDLDMTMASMAASYSLAIRVTPTPPVSLVRVA